MDDRCEAKEKQLSGQDFPDGMFFATGIRTA